MGSTLQPVHVPARAVNGVTRRLADTSKARTRLGFETNISLDSGLRDLVSWWRQEQAQAKVAAE